MTTRADMSTRKRQRVRNRYDKNFQSQLPTSNQFLRLNPFIWVAICFNIFGNRNFVTSSMSTDFSHSTIYCQIVIASYEFDNTKNYYRHPDERRLSPSSYLHSDEIDTDHKYCKVIMIDNDQENAGILLRIQSDLISMLDSVTSNDVVQIVDAKLNSLFEYPVLETNKNTIVTVLDNTSAMSHFNTQTNEAQLATATQEDWHVASQERQSINKQSPAETALFTEESNTLSGLDSSKSPVKRPSKSMGILRVLIARVSGADSQPTPSKNDLIKYTFVEPVSLKFQMYKCSAHQLILVPAIVADDKSGVLEVSLNDTIVSGSHRSVLVNKAIVSMNKQLDIMGVMRQNSSSAVSSTLLEQVADLVLIIIPPGSLPNAWAAYGVIGGRLTVYNDNWGSYVSTTMHEVGHNLGLFHARGEVEDEYGDMTGYMGAAMEEYTYPQQCYNSQNHWHLGWFADRQVDIDSTSLENGPLLLHIAAFVDYDKKKQADGFTYHILARIAEVIFFQYNRAKDYNVGTVELGDKLVIVKLNTTSGTTDVLAGLDSRQSLLEVPIADEGDENLVRNLVVEVCRVVEQKETKGEATTEDGPDYMIISVGYNSSSCKDFLANPNKYKQTNSPSTSPSIARTQQPSVTPSSAIREIPMRSTSSRPTLKPPNASTTTTPASIPTHTNILNPIIQTETITSRITKNRFILILFLVFQVCFLSALFILYVLFVRQYKKQKTFWKFKEDQKRLLAQNGRTNHDAHSLFNEADDELSSTVSFATEQNDKHLYFLGVQSQGHEVS